MAMSDWGYFHSLYFLHYRGFISSTPRLYKIFQKMQAKCISSPPPLTSTKHSNNANIMHLLSSSPPLASINLKCLITFQVPTFDFPYVKLYFYIFWFNLKGDFWEVFYFHWFEKWNHYIYRFSINPKIDYAKYKLKLCDHNLLQINP